MCERNGWPSRAEYALYYGDNLEILRQYVPDDSVDLFYLDPPFQSGKNYNILFESRDGQKSAAQIQAFEDTWTWSLESEGAYREIVEGGGLLALMVKSLRQAPRASGTRSSGATGGGRPWPGNSRRCTTQVGGRGAEVPDALRR